MAQTWNDVLEYIKINLGAPLNKLELSDDDLVKYLRNQVLPVFSQFAPAKAFKAIHDGYLTQTKEGEPIYKYKIPLEEEEYIVDVLNFYFSNDINSGYEDYGYPHVMHHMQAIDAIIMNSFHDAFATFRVSNTWEFLPPDILIFDMPISYGVLEYNTVHKELSSIEPDKYQLMFKKLCLGHVKIWISAMRSKFTNLTTPFGAIELNWDQLKQEGNEHIEAVMQLLNMIPPDFLIHVSI